MTDGYEWSARWGRGQRPWFIEAGRFWDRWFYVYCVVLTWNRNVQRKAGPVRPPLPFHTAPVRGSVYFLLRGPGQRSKRALLRRMFPMQSKAIRKGRWAR